MTYAIAAALQKAIFEALSADAALTSLVADAIYDAPLPLDSVARPAEYLTLGPERVRGLGAKDVDGAVHDFVVTVHSASDGFAASKAVAAAVCDVLLDASLTLERGHLAGLCFLKARADTATPPDKRLISLHFRAFVEDAITEI